MVAPPRVKGDALSKGQSALERACISAGMTLTPFHGHSGVGPIFNGKEPAAGPDNVTGMGKGHVSVPLTAAFTSTLGETPVLTVMGPLTA